MMNEEKIRLLKTTMEELETETTIIKKKRNYFEDSIKVLMEGKRALEFDIGTLKDEIGTEALAEFKKTGIKKLAGGIGIQERSTMTYSPDKAYDFAIEKQMFLQLDKKAFEKVAASLHLPFVVTGTNTIATFPKEIKI